MAKKTSTKNRGKFLKRVHKMTESDIFASIAIASILLNVFFLISVFVLSNRSTYDTSLYSSVKSRYCKNINGVIDRAESIGNEKDAVDEWKVNCLSKDFKPFFNEAVEKFRAQQAQ